MLKKVLVAEDEKDLRGLIVRELRKANYEVFEASDGLECVTIATDKKPDLLILDLTMPNMNGYDAMYQIAAQKWGKEVPIIIFSNLADFSSKMKAYNAARCTYLVKAQTSLAQLVETVKGSIGVSN